MFYSFESVVTSAILVAVVGWGSRFESKTPIGSTKGETDASGTAKNSGKKNTHHLHQLLVKDRSTRVKRLRAHT